MRSNWIGVLALALLAPLIGEYLLGNTPLTAITGLLLFLPLYGAGAVLVRELARRAGRGWPTILGLGLAYGLIEEGLVTQMLFNPHYGGMPGLWPTWLPVPGVDLMLSVTVLGMHAVWSIATPIALVEALSGPRAEQPWLGRGGLVLLSVVFLGGLAFLAYGNWTVEQFVAAPAQLAGTAVLAALIAWLALRGPRSTVALPGRAPAPLLVGVVAFVAANAFFLLPESLPSAWFGTVLALLAAAAVTVLFGQWSRRTGWSAVHRIAAAGAALLTYCWQGFGQTPYRGELDLTKTVGQAILCAGALVLLACCVRAVLRRPVRHTPTAVQRV